MKRYLLAAVAAAAIAAPAQARDGQLYAGIEGGVLFPRGQDVNADLDFTTIQVPTTPAAPAGPADVLVGDAMEADWDRGYDVDAIIGYDFGAFRLEGEFAYKRAKRDGFDMDEDFLAGLNASLNRPSVAPDPGAPGLAPLTQEDFDDLDGKGQRAGRLWQRRRPVLLCRRWLRPGVGEGIERQGSGMGMAAHRRRSLRAQR